MIDYQLWRNVTLFILSSISVLIEGRNPISEFPTMQKKTLFTRILLGQAQFFLYYCAISFAPLAVISIITKIDSFLICILGFIINGEQVVPIELLGMCICFGAIFLIGKSQPKVEDADNIYDHRLFGVILAIGVALFGAGCKVLNRSMRNVPTTLIMFYHGLIGMLATAVYILVESAISDSGIRMMNYTSK